MLNVSHKLLKMQWKPSGYKLGGTHIGTRFGDFMEQKIQVEVFRVVTPCVVLQQDTEVSASIFTTS
jgi:hypothetical protein